MSDSELDSPSMQIEAPKEQPAQFESVPKPPSRQDTQPHFLNVVPVYSRPGQSELKCHFRLKRIYMSRQEKIQQFTERLIKHLGLQAKVAFMQLSNVYRDEGLVDYCFGMYFDEDAFTIIRENVVFRLENKEKQLVSVKPQPMEVFQRMIDKNPVKINPQERYLPPISHDELALEEKLRRRPSGQERVQKVQPEKDKFLEPPKGLHRLVLVAFPQGVTQQELQNCLKVHSKGPTELHSCRWRSDFDVPAFEVLVNERAFRLLTEEGFDHHYYSIIVLDQYEPSVNLLRSISRYQIKVSSNRSMNLLSIYNYFRRCGRLAYVLELNQPNQYLLLFSREPSVTELQRMCTGFSIESIKQSDALNPRVIKAADKFYEMTRKRRQPTA